MQLKTIRNFIVSNAWIAAAFALVTALVVVVVRAVSGYDAEINTTGATELQMLLFPLLFGVLLAGLVVYFLTLHFRKQDDPLAGEKPWMCPVATGLLTLVCMIVVYISMGVWPVGEKSVLIVDLHQQYAPLLAQMRDMILNGDNFLYSFEVGLGTSFLPLFAYYLASPFNLLLLLFPFKYLAEAVIVITLLKNALMGALFAACLQYVYRKQTLAIPIVSVMYTLMMYIMAYNWNLMWLDAVMVLPLVILGFEKMMREGKYLTYILSLAYALYTNYYIGFMLCIFLVLYYVVHLVREQRTAKQNLTHTARFAIGSLLGGGIAMFLLIPTALSLSATSASDLSTMPKLDFSFEITELFGQHLFGLEPTIRSGNLPNIYCGLLAVVLLPIFLTCRTISLRRRLAYTGLLGVMATSLIVNQVDLIWHGLHSPNDLPYRFSFLYSFVLLLIAYETLLHIQHVSPKQIGGSLAATALFILLYNQFASLSEDEQTITFATVAVSLALSILYAVILLLISCKRIRVAAGHALLLAVVCMELIAHGGVAQKLLNANEYYTRHVDYVDNEIAEATQVAIDKMYERIENDGDEFYRVEFLPRRSCVDTSLYDYGGLTVFASSGSYETTQLMSHLGYASNGINSYLYKGYTAPLDSLFGVKYVALTNHIVGHQQLKEVDQVQVGETAYYIYENPYALPLAYPVGDNMLSWNAYDYNPIDTINTMYTEMVGVDNVYTTYPLDPSAEGETTAITRGESAFSINDNGSGNAVANFNVTVPNDGQAIIYVDCRAAESISASAGSSSWSVTPHEPYIIDAGNLAAGDVVTVTLHTEQSCSGNIYVASLNEAVLDEAYAKLTAGAMQVTEHSDRKITGKVTAAKRQLMMTGIPYDQGWTVKVDGKKVDTELVADGAMVGFYVDAGEHDIELSFMPKGLGLGIAVSIASIALTVLLVMATSKKRATATHAKPASAAPISTLDIDEENATAKTVVPDTATPQNDEKDVT